LDYSTNVNQNSTISIGNANANNKATISDKYDPCDEIIIGDGKSRWDAPIKIYTYLYRKLQVGIINIASLGGFLY